MFCVSNCNFIFSRAYFFIVREGFFERTHSWEKNIKVGKLCNQMTKIYNEPGNYFNILVVKKSFKKQTNLQCKCQVFVQTHFIALIWPFQEDMTGWAKSTPWTGGICAKMMNECNKNTGFLNITCTWNRAPRLGPNGKHFQTFNLIIF